MESVRRISELYQALRPLLLSDVAVAVGGSGAAAGGMEAHALSSNWHTGTLAETQAPWAATKNEWATALATHAALADVHHAQVHSLVGGDHTATGLTAGWTLRATGATAFAWGQLQHGDLGGVSANQHHNQVHSIIGGDHTISGSQFQVVGATGSNTLGLLTPSTNPGAAAALLRSDAFGYLQLVRIGLGMAPAKPLSVSGDAGISGNVAAGSATITGAATVGQDFTVGANVLYVNQAGTRVGINRAPDSAVRSGCGRGDPWAVPGWQARYPVGVGGRGVALRRLGAV
jgi:hypothetical protein